METLPTILTSSNPQKKLIKMFKLRIKSSHKRFLPTVAGLLSILVLSICTVDIANAQRTVTGTVIDETDGSPLIGVNVVIKGTTIGDATDIDGNYSVNIPAGNDILIFSFLGYITQEVAIGGRTVVDIVLAPDVRLLDDVIVVGYGTQDEKEITSSVTSVDAGDFNLGNVNDPAQLIQGKVPGLSIYNRGGDPNSTPTIRLRGISTIGANTEPLIVIDGVIGGSLENLDPSDIASMSVLKDGSAAAIYGTRGSSGVIIVTTRKGSDVQGVAQGNVTEFSYDSYVSASSVLKTIEVLNASEFSEAGGNNLGADIDWLNEVTRTAISNVHNFSISGGNLKTNYRGSFNYRDVEGILENSGFEQLNGRFNVSHRAINDKLTVNVNYSLTNRDSDYSFSDALRYAVLFNPTAPILGADANIGDEAFYAPFDGYFHPAGLFDSFNPSALLTLNTSSGESKEVLFNTNVQFDIILDAWLVNATFSRQSSDLLNGEYYSVFDAWRGGAGTPRTGRARRYTENRRSTLFETFSTFQAVASKLDFAFTAGYSFQQDNREDFLMEAGGFPNDELGLNALEGASDLDTSGEIVLESSATPDEKIIAGFLRGNFTWDNSIFFNASLRREGSTKLGEDNQWGLFPAVGIGTDITNFVDIGPLDELKIRVGYGVTGALPSVSGLSLALFSLNSDGTTPQLRAANPDLKWEQKAELNVGVDIGGDRFSGTIEVYNRDISDFILERTVDAAVHGFDRRFENAGKLNTQGLEVSFDYDLLRNNNMLYNTGVTFSTFSTTLEEYVVPAEMRANLGAPGQNDTRMIRVAVGEEIGQIWGPVYSGSVDGNGVPIMEDLNGDGELLTNQTNALDENGDFQQLGSGIPDFEIGWTNQFSYKNWDINAFFRGAFGHSLVNTYRAFYEPRIPSQGSYNLVNTKYADDAIKSAQFSSLYVEEADFFKLDNLTIGYNFDASKWGAVSRFRIYVSGQNLFVLTGYTGVDPEPALQDFGPTGNGGRPAATGDVLSPGIDRRYNYFSSRTFTIGINLKF